MSAMIMTACSNDKDTTTNEAPIVSNEVSSNTASINGETVTTTQETTIDADGNKKTTYTIQEIGEHGIKTDCWTVVDNNDVADITNLFGLLPGEDDSISQTCGKDGTDVFADLKKNNPELEKTLQDMIIGTLLLE